MAGPLDGVKVIELAGVGPGPMCAMLLADLGATVLRIDRKTPVELGVERPLKFNTLLRGRYSIQLDLKSPDAVAMVLELVEQADALIEGFRPGVTERLGLGPEVCLERNPRLIYGRMTGWGQNGPLAHTAGHDINYLSITGVLDAIGRAGQPPSVPLNLLGDYGGGSLYLALGIVAGILETRQSGVGQTVDAAIVDGVTHLSSTIFGMIDGGIWNEGRASNISDTGAPFYDCYECSDGKFVSVGPIEKRFFVQLLQGLELEESAIGVQMNRNDWPHAKALFREQFQRKSRDEWVKLFEKTDACVTPVLTFKEARSNSHLNARGTHVEIDGLSQPAPAPRFSRTIPALPIGPQEVSQTNTVKALSGWMSDERVALMRSRGTLD